MGLTKAGEGCKRVVCGRKIYLSDRVLFLPSLGQSKSCWNEIYRYYSKLWHKNPWVCFQASEVLWSQGPVNPAPGSSSPVSITSTNDWMPPMSTIWSSPSINTDPSVVSLLDLHPGGAAPGFNPNSAPNNAMNPGTDNQGSPNVAPGSPAPPVGAFDPFNTLGSLWNPSSGGGAGSTTGWGFSQGSNTGDEAK